VKLALELMLASLGPISLAGSKFKANTSKYKAMNIMVDPEIRTIV
jgi:hypothetical protein